MDIGTQLTMSSIYFFPSPMPNFLSTFELSVFQLLIFFTAELAAG